MLSIAEKFLFIESARLYEMAGKVSILVIGNTR